MTAPGNVTGEKLAIDYLAQVTRVALRYLPKGDRMKFVGTTRALIERRAGPLPQSDAGTVAVVLAELGEPAELVRQERARLDAAWAKRRTRARSAAPAGTAAPWEQRPLTSRWRPASGDKLRDTPPGGLTRRLRAWLTPLTGRGTGAGQDGPITPGGPAAPGGPATPDDPAAPGGTTTLGGTVTLGGPATPDGTGQDGTVTPGGAATPGGAHAPAAAEPRPAPDAGDEAQETAGAGPDLPGLPVLEPSSLVPPPRRPLPSTAGEPALPDHPTIPGLPVLADPAQAAEPPGSALAPLGGGPGTLVPLTPAGLATLARAQRREAVAVILLAAGLLLPLPCWPLGALVAGFSRFWEARYKWLAWFGPVLVFLVGTLPVAAIAGGRGNPIVVYLHVLQLDARYLVRLGCLATAAYLTWLVRRGRRVRVPPWRR